MISTKHIVAFTLLVASFGVASQAAHADNLPMGGGCYVTGDVDGYPQHIDCTYQAQSGTQTVYVATHNYWTIFVWRQVMQHDACFDQATQTWVDCLVDVQVVLADGYGPLLDHDGLPRTPGVLQVHPVAGETVHIEMYGNCLPQLGTTCGKLGVVETYE